LAGFDHHNVADYVGRFAEEGYLMLPSIVSAEPLAQLAAALRAEFSRVKRSGELFEGGGTISGHLNCFPGAESRFVHDALQAIGIFDLVRTLSPQALRAPNIGCNLNLPQSHAQNNHVDGYASSAFMIVNVAVVPTTLANGAIELTPGSHRRDYKYWEIALGRMRPVRVELNPGDVLIRPSSLWHRGMPNRTGSPRPMLGFSWEEGGSQLADPYSLHAGKITFLPNRYAQNAVGRLRERAFANMPALGASYLFVRSLVRH
jgi:hypothetical protein